MGGREFHELVAVGDAPGGLVQHVGPPQGPPIQVGVGGGPGLRRGPLPGLRDGQGPAGLDRPLVGLVEDLIQAPSLALVQPAANRTQESEGPTPGVRLAGLAGLLLPSGRLPESPVLGLDGRREDLGGAARPLGDLGADLRLDEMEPAEGGLTAEPGVDDLRGAVQIPAG